MVYSFGNSYFLFENDFTEISVACKMESFLIPPNIITPVSIDSGLSVDVLMLTAGKLTILLSSEIVPLSESVTNAFDCKLT